MASSNPHAAGLPRLPVDANATPNTVCDAPHQHSMEHGSQTTIAAPMSRTPRSSTDWVLSLPQRTTLESQGEHERGCGGARHVFQELCPHVTGLSGNRCLSTAEDHSTMSAF
jgi:hypothetical protein